MAKKDKRIKAADILLKNTLIPSVKQSAEKGSPLYRDVKSIEPAPKAQPAKEAVVAPKPLIQPTPAVPQDLAALENEVKAIAQGKDPAMVVWVFETADGSKKGSSLKFYLDCKRNEIQTGQPCNFVRPFGPPVTRMTAPLRTPAPLKAPAPAQSAPAQGTPKKKCAGCK